MISNFIDVYGVMFNQLQWATFLAGALIATIAPTVKAEVMVLNRREAAIADNTNQPPVESRESEAIARQIETAIQITNVQINETDAGLSIELEILEDREPQSFTSGFGATVIIDLINTQLDLATDDSIVQNNPVAGIASVQIAPLDGNSVRITVVGQEQAPAVEVNQADGELIVGVATGEAIANQPAAPPTEEEPLPSADSAEEEEDAIRLIVTGEAAESPYLAPETTGINRTDTSLFEIPQTIQVLPERLLEDQQVIRLQDALLNVPNAVQGNQFGGASEAPIVRGFDQLTILRDGFRRSTVINARQAFQEIANVERIEVLSGPASILYGSIEPGGVVNLVTKRPLSEFFAEAELQVGSFGLIRPAVDITGPVTAAGDLLYRLNVAYERSDGFRNFDTDVERLFIAPTLEWRPSDRTTVTFDLEYLSDRRPFDRGIFPFDDGVVDVPRNNIFGEPGDFAEFETLDIGYRLEHQFSDNWQLRNRFRYSNTDFFNLRAEVNEALGGINQAAGIVVRGFASNDGEVKTFDFQTELIGEFTTGSIDHTVLLGFDILFSSLSQVTTGDLAPVVSLFDPVVGLIDQPNTPLPFTLTDTESDLLQFGIILQDQIQVLPNLTFLLGGRFDFINQRTQAAPIFIPGLAFSPGSEEDQSFTNFSPRLGVVYQPVEPLSLYASYSRSFTPNTLEQTTASGDFLDPQEAEQFEIGVKAELLGGRLAATLALFDLTLRNVAVTDPNNPNAVLPIGQQNSQGLELTVQGEILPGWNIAASYGLLNANIPESPNFPNGATPAHVPENTASLFTTYEIQSGDLAGLGFGLGVFFVDQRFGNFENDFRLDSYWRTDASIFYRSDRWRAGLSFQNIFDEEFFTGGVLRRGTNPGQPFTVVGSISITF